MTICTATNTNKKFKNTVFTDLFNNEDNARELYNALANTNYGPETDVEITTLEDVLFMEQMNDVSFVIDDRIVVLIEHNISQLSKVILFSLPNISFPKKISRQLKTTTFERWMICCIISALPLSACFVFLFYQ